MKNYESLRDEMRDRKSRFMVLPSDIKDSRIDPYMRSVFIHLFDSAKEYNPSSKTISKMCGISETKVKSTLKSLRDFGMIDTDISIGNKSVHTCLPTSSWGHAKKTAQSSDDQGVGVTRPSTWSRDDQHISTNNNNTYHSTGEGQSDISILDECLDILISGFKIAGINLGRHQFAILQQAKLAVHNSGITPEELRPKVVWISKKLLSIDPPDMPRRIHSLIIGASKSPSGIETPADSLVVLRDKAKRLDASPKYGGGESSFIYGSSFMKWSDYDAKIDHLIKELGFDVLKKSISSLKSSDMKPGRISTIAEERFNGDIVAYIRETLSPKKNESTTKNDRPKISLTKEQRDERSAKLRSMRVNLGR